MPDRDIIVIGGSAGALEPLLAVVRGLPAKLGASLFVVLHTSPDSAGALPQILQRAGILTAEFAADGDRISAAHIYVAPADRHLLIRSGTLAVISGPRENGFRPAIDPLFRSAAQAYSRRVVGVILSGALDDGTFGLMAIKQAGGMAVVQHPDEALIPSMPLSAIQNVEVDHIVRSGEMAPVLVQATERTKMGEETTRPTKMPASADRDISLASETPDKLDGPPSLFSCPECGGTLWELAEGGSFRFRCHTGHGFTPDSLLSGQNGNVEQALWSAVRLFQERATLHRKLAGQMSGKGLARIGRQYEEQAQEEESRSITLRQLLRPEVGK
jgi:two-component system, chemotaxis family, protein-glutamate methylesterase/glutaminase